jgi:hypothetical protein
MKKILVGVAGTLFGAAMLMCTAPAMAFGHVNVGVSIGLPIAPIAFVPPPVYVPPVYAPAPVVYGAYGPVYGGFGSVVPVGRAYYYDHGRRIYHVDHRYHR